MTRGFATPRQLAVGLLAGAVGVLALLAPTPGTANPAVRTQAADKPNIVLITADDMRQADLKWMPLTRARFAAHGVQYRNGMSPHPLCCPARAQVLTGQYAQNNGVLTNSGPFGGFHALRQPRNHLGSWLRDAGYTTAFVGKYLNGYRWQRHGLQPGWDFWDPVIRGRYSYTDFTQANNGEPVEVTDGYVTDYTRRTTVDLIEAGADAPFFVWASYVAPHRALTVLPDRTIESTPPIPAPRHMGRHAGVPPDVWEHPAYNEADMRDKPRRLSRARVDDASIQSLFTGRIESLAALDEAVEATFAALERTRELDSSLVVFTSDNGFELGEHRHVGKILAYENSVRVPFLAAGPGLPAGTTSGRVVSIVDLAATFVRAAGATARRRLDGASFVDPPGTVPARRTLLVQAGNASAQRGGRQWTYRGLRHSRYTYVKWSTGEEELYDRRHDPAQLGNRAERRRYHRVLVWARKATRRLGDCAGASCRREPGPPPRVR